MKTFAIVLLFCTATSAFAAPASLQCHSTGVADAGFDLNVANNLHSAELFEITFAGNRPLAQLSCQRLLQAPPRPDVPRNYLLCSGFAPRLGNLVVRLYTAGFTGRQTASVRQVTRVGFRRIERELRFGQLLCN